MHSLKGSVTGCVNGLPNERRFFGGFGRKSISFLIRALVARGISRAVGSRGMSFHNPDVSIAIDQTGRKLLDIFRSALVSFGVVRSNSVACRRCDAPCVRHRA